MLRVLESLFEPLAREFFERKYSVSVFGYKSSITPHPDNPLSRKLSFSPDGFFFDHKQNALKLLELKCPYTRRIVRGAVSGQYLDQIQTDLHLSNLNKAVHVDSCFRMCSWGQLNGGMSHNSSLNNGRLPASSKREVPFAWGVCILFAKRLPIDKYTFGYLISLGSSRTSFQDFSRIMQRIAEKDIWCSDGKVHLSFSDKDQKEEEQPLKLTKKAIEANNHMIFEGGMPVAFFLWKLLDYSAIPVTKHPDFLLEIQGKEENFHKDKNAVAGKISEFIQNPQLAQAKPIKQEFVKFTGNESEHMKSFLQDQRNQIDDRFRASTTATTNYIENLRQQVNSSGTTG